MNAGTAVILEEVTGRVAACRGSAFRCDAGWLGVATPCETWPLLTVARAKDRLAKCETNRFMAATDRKRCERLPGPFTPRVAEPIVEFALANAARRGSGLLAILVGADFRYVPPTVLKLCHIESAATLDGSC